MNISKIRPYIELHLLLLLYSLGGICSKFAAQNEFMSARFLLFYGLVIVDLGIYALVWQQILKKLPLVTAFANKAITVIWGLIWGMIVFKETITIWNFVGAFIIIAGICMVVREDEN